MTFVLVHDTHGHAEQAKTGCSGTLQTLAEDASHGGYIAGGISATYTDKGANGQPALSATAQHVVQLRRHQVEYAHEHEGTSTTASSEADPGGGQVRNSLDPGDWIALNNRVNLAHMDKQITLRFAGPGAFPPFIPVTPAGHRTGRRGGPRRQPDRSGPDHGQAQGHGRQHDLPELQRTARLRGLRSGCTWSSSSSPTVRSSRSWAGAISTGSRSAGPEPPRRGS